MVFLFRDKRLRMRAPFNISFLITEIFGCEFVTKDAKKKNRYKGEKNPPNIDNGLFSETNIRQN